MSSTRRRKNKLLGKTNWFKGGKDKVKYDKGSKKSGKANAKEEVQKVEIKAVLFCDFTKNGELATPEGVDEGDGEDLGVQH